MFNCQLRHAWVGYHSTVLLHGVGLSLKTWVLIDITNDGPHRIVENSPGSTPQLSVQHHTSAFIVSFMLGFAIGVWHRWHLMAGDIPDVAS